MVLELVDLHQEPAGWSDFYRLPARVYAGDGNYLPIPVAQVRQRVERPDFAASQLPLLVKRGGDVVARMVVRVPAKPPRGETERIGQFGFFEATADPAAVARLFDHGREWLRAQGITKVVGPMDGDTWHRYRLNIGPFATPPFLLEPYNPAFYQNLWEDYGFRPLARYYSKRLDDLPSVLAKLQKFHRRCEKNGFSFRPIRLKDFADELQLLYRLSAEIFADNFYYSAISREAFFELYRGARPLIRENLIWFAEDKRGTPCGFVFALPDYFAAVRGMQGSDSWWSKAKFLLLKRRAASLNVKSLGILPRCQGTGLGPALAYLAYREGYGLGYRAANMCLIHEANSSGRLDGDEGELLRQYLLYEYRSR